jgi:hypothetical protein
MYVAYWESDVMAEFDAERDGANIFLLLQVIDVAAIEQVRAGQVLLSAVQSRPAASGT